MEMLAINSFGAAKTKFKNGREYLVAPMAMIVPGVLNGSKGALFYPPEEIEKDISAWQDIPITAYHPHHEGDSVSANHPGILDKQGIGFVSNPRYKNKLIGDGWFDVKKTEAYDKTLNAEDRILPKLKSGKKIELSTGLYTENTPADNGANHNGKPYQFVAKNYRPDHLAVLPTETGACSLDDGCGVHVHNQTGISMKCTVNEDGMCAKCKGKCKTTENGGPGSGPHGGGGTKKRNFARDNQEGYLKKHGYKETSMMSGQFLKKEGDTTHRVYLKDASHIKLSTGVLHEQHNWNSEHTTRPAGAEAPTAYHTAYGSGSKTLKEHLEKIHGPTGNQEMTKWEKIQFLTTNCKCWKGEGDDKVLNGLPETKLDELVEQEQKKQARILTKNCEATKKPGPCKEAGDAVASPTSKPAFEQSALASEASHSALKTASERGGQSQHDAHAEAADEHFSASEKHTKAAETATKNGDKIMAGVHETAASAHEEKGTEHAERASAIKRGERGEKLGPGEDKTAAPDPKKLKLNAKKKAKKVEEEMEEDEDEVVDNGGPGSGPHPMGKAPHVFSKLADKATKLVQASPTPENHEAAYHAHEKAAQAHTLARDSSLNDKKTNKHAEQVDEHRDMMKMHMRGEVPITVAHNSNSSTTNNTVAEKPKEKKPMTYQEWIDSAPPEANAAQVWNTALKIVDRDKMMVINHLTKHLTDPAMKQKAVTLYNTKHIDELTLMADLMPAPVENKDVPKPVQLTPLYGGAGVWNTGFVPPVENADKIEDCLPLPTMNWDVEETAGKHEKVR